MAFDWDLFSRFLAPVVGVGAGALINQKLERRPKLVSYLAHSSAVKVHVPDGEPLVVNSHSVVIRNAGRKPAVNVRLGHTALPDFSMFPPCDYQVIQLPENSGTEICIPVLVADQQITITYLYYPPMIWSGINTYTRSDEGFAKIINVLPTPQPSRLIRCVSAILVIIGATTLLYSIAKVLIFILRLASRA